MLNFFQKKTREKPPYLERIDELEKVNIIRAKGKIDQAMIPVIEARIQENRRMGSRIDKNVILDFAKVDDVDSATIAFHIVRIKEYQDKGFKIGFINIPPELETMLAMFKQSEALRVFASEEEAVKELNK